MVPAVVDLGEGKGLGEEEGGNRGVFSEETRAEWWKVDY